MKGLFITFEGGEGSGKTTVIRRIARWLKKKGKPVLVTREPGGTPLANRIRFILLNPKNRGLHLWIELFLYIGARKDHVDRVIRPALARGAIVLCDRYADATTVYQGYARGLPLPFVQRLNELATGGLWPNRTFLFDLPVRQGLKRTQHRKKGYEDRFENEDLRFHQKVRKGYLTLATMEKKRFRIIPALRPLIAVEELITKEIQKVI